MSCYSGFDTVDGSPCGGSSVGSILPGPTATAVSGGNGNSDAASWLSGLGDFLGGAGAFAKDVFQGINQPAPPNTSAWRYNASTGLYYDAQGRVVTSTGQLPTASGVGAGISGNTVLIAAAVIFGFLLLRKRA